ncbi:MAG: hypothetical protein QXG86_00885 [Candidatus Woesearchaeota archaeon]
MTINNTKMIFILLAIFIFNIPFVNAIIEQYSFDFTISLGKVFVTQKILFDKKTNFSIDLPSDATNIKIIADEKEVEYSKYIYAKEIIVQYITSKYIEKNNFISEIFYPDEIKNLYVKVVLPVNSVLAYPYEEKTRSSEAIFPRPTKLATDGQRIIIIWEKENLEKYDSLPIFVKFKEKRNYDIVIYILIAAILALFVYIKFRRKQKVKTIIKKEDMIEKHLKEDEEQIVNILKQRENKCEQGTLRVITGFSKAKLSGLLKELEDRKIIYKEKKGKKNIIFLRK